MPPRHQSLNSTNFLSVHTWLSSNFTTELMAVGMQMWLGTFKSPHKDARAYDAVVWRVDRHRDDMKFPKIVCLGSRHRCLRRHWRSAHCRRSSDTAIRGSGSPSLKRMSGPWLSGGRVIPRRQDRAQLLRPGERRGGKDKGPRIGGRTSSSRRSWLVCQPSNDDDDQWLDIFITSDEGTEDKYRR
jgi:hypothetical protein